MGGSVVYRLRSDSGRIAALFRTYDRQTDAAPAAPLVPDAAGGRHVCALAQQRPVGDAFYLIMTGISSAIASTLATALWVQLFGPAQLARVRSAVEAGMVVVSGASPVIMGVLIDHQVTLRLQAMLCLIYIVSASLLATRIKADVPDINF